MSVDRAIEKLRSDHAIGVFDCGQPGLNRWLMKHAMQSASSGSGQTYVGVVKGELIGYYTLAVGQVEYGDAPERLKKGLAKHPIPAMLLARLAVSTGWQRKGVGRALLRDAMLRTLRAAKIAGIRAFAVHAKDDAAREYYEQFDFVPSFSDPFHLSVLLKDLCKLAGEGESVAHGD